MMEQRTTPALPLCLLVVATLALSSACSKPTPPMDELLAHLKQQGVTIGAFDAGAQTALLKGVEDAMNDGGGRGQRKTVMTDGLMVVLHRFENARAAERFYEVAQKVMEKEKGKGLLANPRVAKLLGTKAKFRFGGFIATVHSGMAGRDDAAAAKKVEAALRSFKP